MSIIPVKGERAAIFGMTGSGKTAFACWLLKRLPDECCPVIIYDTKIEPKFEALPNSTVVETIKSAFEVAAEAMHDYIVVRPSIEMMNNPYALDQMLLFHYHNLQGMAAYIDEAYTFHINSQAGPGLTALMTRGRSKGITTILSSQRPARISRFLITESETIYSFRLRDKLDRKRLDDVSEDFSKREKIAKHWFYHIGGDDTDQPTLYRPIPLDAEMQTGYVDKTADEANSVPTRTPAIWI